MKHRFTFFLLMCMCLFEAHAQVKSAALPACGSLPVPAFASQTITVRSATTADVSVTWSAVGATSYKIFYKISGASQFSTSCTTSTTNCTIGSLLLGNTYTIRVEAHRLCLLAPGENDEDVTTATTTVTLPTPIPPAPVGVAIAAITLNSFVASWSPTPAATSYRLDVSSSQLFSPGETILFNFALTTTSKLITGLVSGTTYFFRVRAVNASGTSGNSLVFPVTTLLPAPVITSFTPSSGPVHTVVTISGTNFNEQVNNNIVFFGATRADVFAATSTSLSVLVPFGTTFEPISVLNTSSSLTGYSASPFVTTFSPVGQTLNGNSFVPKSKFRAQNITTIKTADLDGDGKPDLIAAGGGNLLLYRNISLRGNLDSTSFAPPIELANGILSANRLAVDDLNGDGKLDIIATLNGGISVFLNTSSPGNINFTVVNIGVFDQINSIAAGDLDGDGKPDLVLLQIIQVAPAGRTGVVTVLHNTFSALNPTIFSVPGVAFPAGRFPISIAIGDLDNDLKPELAVTDVLDNTVSVYKNTSLKGAITPASFGSKIDFATGSPSNVVIGDLDRNEKQELVVGSVSKVSVFDNIGPSGSFSSASLAPRVDYTVSAGDLFKHVAISDLNGDARPELIANGSVLLNTSIIGDGRSSFAQGINYLSGLESFVFEVIAGDLDDDGIPDLVTANQFVSSGVPDEHEIAFLHNNLASDSIPNVFVANPTNGSTGFLPTVNVTANALGGALTYTIQLSPEQDFSSGVLEKSGARGQRFTGLSYGTRYFARVKTNLSPNFGKTTSFSTIPAEDLAFVTSPANGAIDQSPNLTVASNTVPGATSYTIELNTSLFFLASDAIIKTGNRTQSFTGLSYNKTYYSRVRTEFTQNWGETRSFTITDASKISFITSPADGSTGQLTTLNLICSQVPGATEFTVTIRSGDSPLVRVFTSNSRTIRVSGLDPNTLQHVQVRTNLSPLFGPIRTFTTGAALGALTAYPNPASNQVTIKNLKQGSSIKIVDALSGTLVETFRATGEELTIETTKYRRGLYYVTQVNADGTEDESVRLVVN